MIECVQCLCPYNGSPGAEKAVTACCGGNVPALKALIQAGVSVNHVTSNSSATLLHMAAYCGQVGDLAGPQGLHVTYQSDVLLANGHSVSAASWC